jgi:hypothetical protein
MSLLTRNLDGNPLQCDCGLRWLQRFDLANDTRLQNITVEDRFQKPKVKAPSLSCSTHDWSGENPINIEQANLTHCGEHQIVIVSL